MAASGRATTGDDRCGQWFAALDEVVAAVGTGDGQYAPVPGFGALRASRFLVAITPDADDDGFRVWAERLRRLDAQARAIEIGNAGLGVPQAAIERCGRSLLAGYLAVAAQREALVRAAHVPDDYSTAARVVGLYPLTSAPFSIGVHRLHEQTRERFATAAPATIARRYAAPAAARLSSAKVAALIAGSADNTLGIPEPGRDQLARLFATFAPTLVVDGDASSQSGSAPVEPPNCLANWSPSRIDSAAHVVLVSQAPSTTLATPSAGTIVGGPIALNGLS